MSTVTALASSLIPGLLMGLATLRLHPYRARWGHPFRSPGQLLTDRADVR